VAPLSTIRFLRTFLAVEKHGSFAAAADRMALTQAAVGQQMRALEVEFRRSLFDRSRRVIKLNSAGRDLVPHAQRVLAAYEAMLADADAGAELAGAITVGAIISAMGFLSENLVHLKQRYPALKVRLLLGPNDDLAEQVRSGAIDAAIVVEVTREASDGMRWTPLYEEPLVLVASARVAGPRAEVTPLLKSQPFIRFKRQAPTGAKIEQALRRLRVKPDEIMEVNSVAAIVDLVRQNVGIAILPLLKHADWMRDPALAVLPLPYRAPARVIGMIEGERQPQMTAAVRQLLLQALQ
jgi:DNA-binding transcriptional LysR family regulator